MRTNWIRKRIVEFVASFGKAYYLPMQSRKLIGTLWYLNLQACLSILVSFIKSKTEDIFQLQKVYMIRLKMKKLSDLNLSFFHWAAA